MNLLVEYIGLIEKKVRKDKKKRVLYHIGPRPARPQLKLKSFKEWDDSAVDRRTGKRTGEYVVAGVDDSWKRYWLDSPVKSGVFLTPNWEAISSFHGRIGNVYAYRVPEWVIEQSGGIHRYDSGSELLIPEEIWNQAGDEIEFLGISASEAAVDKKYERNYGHTVRALNRALWGPAVLDPDKPFNLKGLRATKHPVDVIKLLKPAEREKALVAVKQALADENEALFYSEKDQALLDLLQKHLYESTLRACIKKILTEKTL